MNTTTLNLDLNERSWVGVACRLDRSDRPGGRRAIVPARADRPCKSESRPRLADSVMVRRLDLIEVRNRGMRRSRTPAAELRAAAQEAAEQARGERLVFAILATGSVALLAAAGAQSLQFVAQWTSFVKLVASVLA